MSSLIIALIIIIISLLGAYVAKKRGVLKELPESPTELIAGHYFQINSTTNILKAFSKFTNNASITRIRLGPTFIGILSKDLKFAKFLLSSNRILKKSENYQFWQSWLGSGLLLSDGTKWKHDRKLLTPAFHFTILKQFVGIFESVGDVFIEKLQQHDGSASLDLYPLVTLCTLDIICETAMGAKINAQNGENLEYVNGVKEMCRIMTDRCLSFVKYFPTFVLTPDYWLQKKLLKILHGFAWNVINAKTKKFKNSELCKRKRMALLDLMVEFSLFTPEEIRQQVDMFMFAGHDTTASGICFTLYCLANHPDAQEKVFKEQKDLFGNEKNPVVTSQDLENMKYLELVIKESLRLYPPVPSIGRRTTEDTEYDGVHIPEDINIAIFIYGMHRNPEYFPDPDKFDPERFDGTRTVPPFAYVPFSAGPRNCIGQRFAMLEMKSTISKVVRHFKLKGAIPKHDLLLSAETVLKSLTGVKVGLTKRD